MKEVFNHISIQNRMAEGMPAGRADETTVRRMWWAALDILQQEILMPMDLSKGIWLSSPLPALYEPKLLEKLKGWVWAPEELENLNLLKGYLLPPSRLGSIHDHNNSSAISYQRLPLKKDDGYDPLLIILTPEIQIALTLQGSPDKRSLIFRSDKETFFDLLKILDMRLKFDFSKEAEDLKKTIANIGPFNFDVHLERLFWPRMAERLAGIAPSLTLSTVTDIPAPSKTSQVVSNELTLLEAITHEVRTPLATIRTLIRSLLRRKDLSKLVLDRLSQIDGECTEQIERFGLIFNAAELHRQPIANSMLASTDLGNMLKVLHIGWSAQLERRGLKLQLDISSDLPHVLSDSERLEPMLGGLIDRTSRGLKPGGLMSLKLRPAGPRLKLQILAHSSDFNPVEKSQTELEEYLGPVLSWNPNTGSLQLSQEATQQLFASLGGRLTQRRGRGLTVFFPIVDGNF